MIYKWQAGQLDVVLIKFQKGKDPSKPNFSWMRIAEVYENVSVAIDYYLRCVGQVYFLQYPPPGLSVVLLVLNDCWSCRGWVACLTPTSLHSCYCRQHQISRVDLAYICLPLVGRHKDGRLTRWRWLYYEAASGVWPSPKSMAYGQGYTSLTRQGVAPEWKKRIAHERMELSVFFCQKSVWGRGPAVYDGSVVSGSLSVNLEKYWDNQAEYLQNGAAGEVSQPPLSNR